MVRHALLQRIRMSVLGHLAASDARGQVVDLMQQAMHG